MADESDRANETQQGGAPGASDMAAPGGSGGTGGYGSDMETQRQQRQGERGEASDPSLSRGERFDEMQGGGRGADTVSFDEQRDGDDFAEDQRAHQDRGQGAAGDEEVE